MNGKPISEGGFRPSFNRVLLNVECPNEMNQRLTQDQSVTLIWITENAVFFKGKHNLESYLTLS